MKTYDPVKVSEKLARVYGYKPLPIDLSEKYRQWFQEQLPCDFKGNEEGGQARPLFSLRGVCIATGYTRIVIGDYGAYIEMTDAQIIKENICVKPGMEKRIYDPRFKYAKYLWYIPKGEPDCKLYHQRRTVEYADYVPGMWYVSPYQVKTENK